MWLLFGAGAIVFTALHVVFALRNKESKWYLYLSLSFTALTVCSFYADGANKVMNEDWSGLTDVMPAMSTILWICTIASILINAISLFIKKK